MSDVDKHFARVKSLARHQAEREWLRQQYEVLARQRAVVDALAAAREGLWDSNERELGELAKLQTHAARVTIATCETIMRHSGGAGLMLDDQLPEPDPNAGEGREEELPW